jgi:HEAT repeat protein
MTGAVNGPGITKETSAQEEKSDWKVVLQFFIVPLALVAVLVTVFFGLQVLRSRHPDARATLTDLRSQGGFLLPWVGDPKRWQSGYDLSLLLRSGEEGNLERLVPEMTVAFREARRGGDLQLRRYLALAIGRAADERGVPPLEEGLDDDDDATRLYCTWGLMQVGGFQVLPALRRAATSHTDAGVRKMAVFALGQLQDRSAAPALLRALGDQDRDVRWNAALSLARIGDASGEAVLIEILESEGNGRGAEAVSPALNAIRGLALLKDDQARASLLRAAQSSPTREIRETARQALETLESGASGALP